MKKLPGFSLIELLVVVAIIMVLSGVSLVGYNNFNERQQVVRDAQNLASNLRLAQQWALSGYKPTGWCRVAGQTLLRWEVVVTAAQYTIQGICSSGAASVAKTVAFANVQATVAATISFLPLTGAATAGGTITLHGTSAVSGENKIISVTQAGAISVQ